jgi:hypothetical protein
MLSTFCSVPHFPSGSACYRMILRSRYLTLYTTDGTYRHSKLLSFMQYATPNFHIKVLFMLTEYTRYTGRIYLTFVCDQLYRFWSCKAMTYSGDAVSMVTGNFVKIIINLRFTKFSHRWNCWFHVRKIDGISTQFQFLKQCQASVKRTKLQEHNCYKVGTVNISTHYVHGA